MKSDDENAVFIFGFCQKDFGFNVGEADPAVAILIVSSLTKIARFSFVCRNLSLRPYSVQLVFKLQEKQRVIVTFSITMKVSISRLFLCSL